MKFVQSVYYVLIIILRSAVVVQNTAHFAIEELTHISQELSPIECMRLLEAIYLVIPNGKGRRVVRETPLNTWIPRESCLSELKAWNHRLSDETEPKPRVVMIQHLNALGRPDLANYVRKNQAPLPVSNDVVEFHEKSGKYDQQYIQIPKDKISGGNNNKIRVERHYPYPAKVTLHGVQSGKDDRRSNRYKYNDIRHPMFAAISEGATRNAGQAAGSSKGQPEKGEHGISRNSLFLMIALGIVVFFVCGIVFLIFLRLLKNSSCPGPGERSDLLSPRTNIGQEKGLQCIRCFPDHEDYETQSNCASQISEIDVEGGSCCNSAGKDSRKSCTNSVLYGERITPIVSIEKLKLFDEEEEPATDGITKATRPMNSCRCRPREPKACGPNKPKKKKDKLKLKCRKDETKTKKNYLKVIQDKISPRRHRKPTKKCTFDTKQLQDKILTILNQECGVCRCCDRSSHWEVDADPKDNNKSARDEEGPANLEEKQSSRDKREKSSIAKGGDKEVVIYQASRSPMTGMRSSRKHDSDSGNKSTRKAKKKEKSGRLSSFRLRKAKDRRVLLSSSSETDEDDYNDSEKRKKYKSKR